MQLTRDAGFFVLSYVQDIRRQTLRLFARNPQRILGAIVPFNGGTWFFKLMGPDALVAKAKPGFLEFLKTVRPAQP